MTINIPRDLAISIEAAVVRGDFDSLDAAMTEAARLLIRKLDDQSSPIHDDDAPPDPLLGLMRDDADLMDEIVAEAYRNRREDEGRDFDL